MGDTADFTFCQVNKMDNVLESPKTIPDTSQNHIVKNQSDGLSMNKLSNSIQGIAAAAATTSTASEESRPEKQDSAKTVDGLIKVEDPITARKPKARAKVPFEKGYSQMDWLKVTRTHPDLAGLKGKSNRRLISLDEVKKHKSGDSIWTVLKGRVYNISPYVKFHPGGIDMIMQTAGKDCTSLFNKYHAWVNAEFLLEKCLVGFLDDSL